MPDPASKDTWAKVTLSDCCEEIGQRLENPAESGYERFVGLEHLESGETSIRCWGSTEDVTSSMKLFKAGDVIVARRNVYLRRAARADFDGVCSGDGIVLRASDKTCLPDLLPFLVNTAAFWDYVSSQADGTMSKRITVNRLMAYELDLPPLEEQRRIVEALTGAHRTSEALLGLHRHAVLTLESLGRHVFEVFGSRELISDYCAINPEVLRGDQLSSTERWHYIDLSAVEFPIGIHSKEPITLNEAPSRARRVTRYGDILVSTVRPNLRGHAMVETEEERLVASTGFAVIRSNRPEFRPIIFGLILSHEFIRHCASRVSGTSYPAVRAKDVGEFEVPDVEILLQNRYNKRFQPILAAVGSSWKRYSDFRSHILPELSHKVFER